MSNALKYTPEGGRVDVTLSLSGSDQRVKVTISDTGPGISPEHLPHIFDRFYRIDDSHTTEGTGIGLALVKELVQLHHGTITAESEQGKGQFSI